jgi:type VI protein secretion system component Hcp
MKATHRHTLIPGLLALAMVAILDGLAGSASAAEVQACLALAGSLSIGDDPASCAAGNRVDAVSVKLSLATAGKPQVGPLVLAKRLDETSPALFISAATTRVLPNVLGVIFESGTATSGGASPVPGRRLFSILLSDAVIASLEDSAEDGGLTRVSPLEVLSFSYGRIALRDDVTGAVGCFDVLQSKAC